MKLSAKNSFAFKNIIALGQLLMTILLSVATTSGQQPLPDNLAQFDVKELVIGTPLERQITQGQVHLYRIELKQGEVVRVNVKEKGADVGLVFVRVRDDWTASAVSEHGAGFMRESLTLIVTQDGLHMLLVRAEPVTDLKVPASYELLATRDVKASKEDSQRAHAEFLFEDAVRDQHSGDQQSLALGREKLIETGVIFRSLGDKYWEAKSEVLIGVSYTYSTDPAKGVAALKNALRIFQELNDEPAVAQASFVLAGLYMNMGEQEQANALLSRSLTISRKVGDKRSESLSGMVITGNMMRVCEQPLLNNYSEEISRARARNDKYAETLIWTKHLLRNYCIDAALVIGKRTDLFTRAESEALPLVRALKERDLEIFVLFGLGARLYNDEGESRSLNQKSLNYLCQALMLAQIQNNQLMQAFAYLQLKTAYTAKNHPLAIFLGKKAVDVIHEIRSGLSTVDKERQQAMTKLGEVWFTELAADLIREGRFAEGIQILNRVREQEFFDSKLLLRQPTRLTLTEREAKSSAAIAAVSKDAAAKYANVDGPDFDAMENEITSLLHRLEQTFAAAREAAADVPEAADLQSAMRGLSLGTRQKHVVIYLSSEADKLFLVTSEAIKAYSRPPSEFNDDPVPEFLRSLSSPKVDPRPAGARIYRKIFKQVELVDGNYTTNTLEAELARYQPNVLHWSIGGNLRYVPMAALYDPATKQYLVEKFQNVVFTRISKDRFLNAPTSWSQGVGLGTAVAYEGFPALSGVVEELTLIFGKSANAERGLVKGKVFLDKSFTLETLLSLKLLKPSLVHIASHFKFQPGDFRNSFLLLGDGSRISLFEWQRIYMMFEGVDLITLSACETAAQQADANGKEVDGFAELAQRQGANSVIATLWKISDGATAKLMADFYRLRMQNPGVPKSEILQRAQLNLLRSGLTNGASPRRADRGTDEENATAITSFSHPYYWAAFVLYGSSR